MTGQDVTGPGVRAAITALRARAADGGPDGAIRAPITATPVAGGRGLIIDVPAASPGACSGPLTAYD